METTLPADAIPINEAAKVLHCHPSKIIRWVLGGVIPGWRVQGPHKRRWFVSRSDLLERIERIKPTNGQAAPDGRTARNEREQYTSAVLKKFGLE